MIVAPFRQKDMNIIVQLKDPGLSFSPNSHQGSMWHNPAVWLESTSFNTTAKILWRVLF